MEEDGDWELRRRRNGKDVDGELRKLRRRSNEKDMDWERRRSWNNLPYMDSEEWSPWDNLPQEKDIFKQHQNHLTPSSSPESQLFLGEEILRPYVKKLRTRPSDRLPKLVKHSDASVNGDIPGERNTASKVIVTTYFVVHIREIKTETAYDDGYSWTKYWQKAIAGSKYPREFFRCIHHRAKGCPARKQVQKLDEDPTLFKVIHLRRHTCKQFSHLYTGAALDTTEDDSDYTVFSRNIEVALMWTIARLDGYSWRKIVQSDDLGFKYPTISGYFRCTHSESEGCLACKCVERLDRGRTRFKVTHMGKHTCGQFSHSAAPTKAASDDKELPGKIKTQLLWTASVADKYSWRKSKQEDIPVSEYPGVYYRCIYHLSQGCPATKQVQRSNDDSSIFEVTYEGRHTCEQSSHLATDAAVEPTKAASDDKDVSRNTKTTPKWTATTFVDGYSWKKQGLKTIAVHKYPGVYYLCSHNNSQGCCAIKCFQRSNDDPSISAVTYWGRHTCEQSSSHLLQQIEAESENTRLVQRSNNDSSISEVTNRERHTYEQSSSHLPQLIEAESENTRLVQRWNNDPSISEITYQERHTCEQSSSHLPQLIEAESKEKPKKSKMVSFVRILVVASVVLELSSTVFDQLSSIHKPHYALILMLLSFASLVSCIVKLVCQVRKKRVSTTRGNNNRNSFSNVAEIVEFTCAICQSILTTANYVLLIKHTKIQIHISVWGVIFAFALLYVEFSDRTDESGGERSSHTEVGQGEEHVIHVE